MYSFDNGYYIPCKVAKCHMGLVYFVLSQLPHHQLPIEESNLSSYRLSFWSTQIYGVMSFVLQWLVEGVSKTFGALDEFRRIVGFAIKMRENKDNLMHNPLLGWWDPDGPMDEFLCTSWMGPTHIWFTHETSLPYLTWHLKVLLVELVDNLHTHHICEFQTH